jgi:PAS domain S-box-containing protein
MDFLNRFITIDSADPDDSRRRRLLNIILLGTAVVVFLSAVLTALAIVLQLVTTAEGVLIVVLSVACLIGFSGIYAINRYLSGRFASVLFLFFLMIVIGLSDSPLELVNGRSLFQFVIPIIISSVLLAPSASFIFYALVTIEIEILASVAGIAVNIPAVSVFLLIALLSWLSSRSLEQALRDLRTVNINLDRLVAQRTQALAESLSRERVEAGRSRAILDSIADGVIVFNTEGKATVANPAISRLTGLPIGRILGSTMRDLAQSETLTSQSREIVENLLEKTKRSLMSLRIDWDNKVLSVSAADVYDSTKTHIGTVTVFRDFTREAEVERMKSTFLGVISHELRTPLNAILGYAEMFKEAVYGPLNEKQAGATDRILTNSKHLLSLVNDLLDQAQIEAGKLTIQMRPLRLAELLDNLHGQMDKIAADKGLEFTSKIDAGVPEIINGDPQRLQQILDNLVTNAFKFTDTGTVHVIISVPDAHHWTLEVVDTGQGIPEDAVPYIFDTFRQVESSATRKHRGVGLGLAIVKQLVQLMSGSITVKSKVGVGSIFTVSLPLVVPEEVNA